MALNEAGILRRTREDEVEDSSQVTQNILDESWKDWPNEAGVSPSSCSTNNPHLLNILIV